MAIRRTKSSKGKLSRQRLEYVQLLVIFAVITLVIVVLLVLLLLSA